VEAKDNNHPLGGGMQQALEYAEAGQTSLVLLLFSFLILAVVYAVNRKVWAVWPKNC
jgi:type I site-specific restriction endonuclease